MNVPTAKLPFTGLVAWVRPDNNKGLALVKKLNFKVQPQQEEGKNLRFALDF